MRYKIKNIKNSFLSLYHIFTKQQRLYALLVFFASLVGALLETLGVSAILPLITSITQSESVKTIPLFGRFLSHYQTEDARQLFFFLCMVLIAVFVLKNVYYVFLSWLRIKYSFKIRREISMSVMRSYMHRNYDFVTRKTTGEITREIDGDIESLYTVVYQGFHLVADLLTIALIGVYIFLADWRIAICLVILAIICLIFITSFFKKRLQTSGKERLAAAAEGRQVLFEAFHGIKEVFVMRKQHYYEQLYYNAYLKKQRAGIVQTVSAESPTYLIEGLCVTGLLAFIGITSLAVEDLETLLPVLSSVAMGAFRIMPSLGRISVSLNAFILHAPAIQTVHRNINALKASKSSERSIVNYDIDGTINDFSNHLVLRDVRWKYNDDDEYLLKDISIEINKGESIGFIGQSGAGKSTLMDIILGLHTPQEGSIEVDGINISQIPESWSRLVGYVPQAIFLFNGSVRRNVAFGVDENEIDDILVWEALNRAQLSSFVKSLPAGLDTLIGERGVNLSGGQQQRLAIARALYRSPEILILDEATSSLDNDTEAAFMEAIEKLQGELTLIIVAHRLTTVRKCDRIFEIIDGTALARKKDEVLG